MTTGLIAQSIFFTLMFALVLALATEIYGLLKLKEGVSVGEGVAAGILKYLRPDRFFKSESVKVVRVMRVIHLGMILVLFCEVALYVYLFG